MNDSAYIKGLFYILRERAGAGGWPPRDISKVSGWLTVRMLAAISDRTVREVAADLIENANAMETLEEEGKNEQRSVDRQASR